MFGFANGSGGGVRGLLASCVADGDDCGRQNVSKRTAGTARSADRIRKWAAHMFTPAEGAIIFSDGADLQGFVAGADVVRTSRRSKTFTPIRAWRSPWKRWRNQGEVGQGNRFSPPPNNF